jgi:hypothetical protein
MFLPRPPDGLTRPALRLPAALICPPMMSSLHRAVTFLVLPAFAQRRPTAQTADTTTPPTNPTTPRTAVSHRIRISRNNFIYQNPDLMAA